MVKKFKVVHDRDICIGCSACASVCPKYWDMNSDGKSDLKDAKSTGDGEETVLGPLEKDFEGNMDAAESCPVNCIHIFEIKDNNKENKLI